ALDGTQLQSRDHPAERSAPIAACGRCRRRVLDALTQVPRRHVVGEERALVVLVADEVECGDCTIDGRRDRGRPGRRGAAQVALAPQPADLTPQTERDLRQPVLRERVVTANAGHEGHRFGRRGLYVRVARHGTVTPGLALACWLFTRRITR